VQSCESPAASIEWDGEYRPSLYWGFDVARKRDLSVIWIVELLEDGSKLTRGVVTMSRQTFDAQKQIARQIAAICERGCIDATGIGANLAEDLAAEFPGRVEGVEFSGPNKERMAIAVKTDMESRSLLIPESVTIRRSIQSVKRYVGTTGAIRFDAARTAQGHGDEFWALALANAAAQHAGSHVPIEECGPMGRTVMGNAMEKVF
jgi:phage FluMu gp28-like protein